MDFFDDSRLEDPQALAAADPLLRPLAEAGARLRREFDLAAAPLAGLSEDDRPRAIIVFGPEARLVRAVLEPTCPVPLVAWPRLGLPGWVGPLDLVVVLGGGDRESRASASEAVRRGCRVLVVASADSSLARASASRSTTLLPMTTGDPTAAAIIALTALSRFGLAPRVDPSAVATAMDQVAIESSAALDSSQNPAKEMALALADAQPLVWGGSILAARASRRVAEALRTASGRVVLSADASELVPLLARVRPRDPFADPFEEVAGSSRPGLVMVDDGLDDAQAQEERERLEAVAQTQEVKVIRLRHGGGDPVCRYVQLLQSGLFGAAYLQIGLRRG